MIVVSVVFFIIEYSTVRISIGFIFAVKYYEMNLQVLLKQIWNERLYRMINIGWIVCFTFFLF